MAYGAPFSPDLPVVSAGAGMKTPFGITLLPPGSRIAAYVRSTGAQAGDDPFTATNLVTTLAAGLARARAGLGDTVVVMPGHTESVTDATMMTGLVAGTRIVGFGRGSNMPVFRWTATAAQWAIAVADVTIQGLRLRLEGANGVVKAILVTGADVGIYACDIETGSGASNKATIGIEAGAGSTRFEFIGNVVRGTTAGASTNILQVVAAVDGVRITDNEMIAASTTTNGLINITAAATSLKVMRNVLYNTVAASTTCIRFADVASDGIVSGNEMATLNNGVASAQGITFAGTNPTIRCTDNNSADEPRAGSIQNPPPPAS